MRSLKHFLLILAAVLAPGLGLAQDQFFDSNGVRIRYTDQGQGPVIVLLHGNTMSLDVWSDAGVLQGLVDDHRVIAFDARGHGQSDKPHAREDYGPEMGRDLIRLLDHLKLERVHAVGYSMGAIVVAQLLTTHPDRFASVTLGGAPGRFRWTDEDTARFELEAKEKEVSCISRSQIFRLTPPDRPRPSEEELRRRSHACMANSKQDRFALAAFHRSLQDLVITPEQAASADVPMIGIVGSRDPYLAEFEALKELRPTLELVVVEGARHGGSESAYRRPEFVEAVREFIAEPR